MTASLCQVHNSPPGRGRSDGKPKEAQAVERPPSKYSRPGRKPRVEVPQEVRDWLERNGLRVVPRARSGKGGEG